jgi:ubiquinone/menaquinone biosynthesis C-methylase UbiE
MKNTINFDIVADIYDSYVNVDYDIPFFLKETENYEKDILELMCGTGRISIPLLQAGKRMVCVDYSNCMLDIFKSKISGKDYNLQLINIDVAELKFQNKFGMILLPFHSLSEILEKEKQLEALNRISECLETGGTFICALQNPAIKLKTADGIKRSLGEFRTGNNKKILISYMNKRNPGTGIVSGYQVYELFDENNLIIETRRLEINFLPVSDKEFQEMVGCAGMKITDVFGDYSYSPFVKETSDFMIYRITK